MGPPIEDAADTVNKLFENGHLLIVHTAWPPERHHVIKDWLAFYNIRYHDVTNIKPNADIFIDDKAITFTTWKEIMGEL